MKVYIKIFIILCLLPIVSADLFPTPSQTVSVGFQNQESLGVSIVIPDEIFNSSAADSNSSRWWNTVTLGPMDDANSLQFDNIGGTLTIDESHIELIGNDWWLRRDGTNSPTSDINWSGNDLVGVRNLNMSKQILIEFNDSNFENSSINIVNNNPWGIASQKFENSRGEEYFLSMVSHQVSQVLFPDIVESNDSVMGMTGDGVLFLGTLSNKSIFFGSSPNRSIELTEFFLRINPDLQSLEIQGNKYIRPVKTNGVETMVFESDIGAVDGELTFIFAARNSENRTVIQSARQIGRNNSASILGQNSQIVAPKDFLTMPADVKAQWENNTGDPIIEEWFSNITDCLIYEEYLQGLGLLDEGLSGVCDTTGRLVPQSILGDVDVVRALTSHESLTAFNALNFIGRNGNDVNMLFNGGLENGKLLIRDKRQIEANITFFDTIITDFDDGTIFPFVSESIAPEVGRDWDSVLETECHQDRCGNAKGGSEKVMAFSGSTTFQGGTVASNNTRLMFWLTSVLSGGDLFEVELDNNEGDVSTIYSTGATLVDEFVNVSFGAAFENRSNVTTRFILNGQNVIREVWVDIVQVTSEPAEPIIINESFDGGKVVFGEDRNSLSCLIEADKRLNNQTLESEWVMNIGSAGCSVNIAGNVTFEDSTVTNQTVIGDQLVTGDLTVGGLIYGNGSQLTDVNFTEVDPFAFHKDGTSTMAGNANFGGFDLDNVGNINQNEVLANVDTTNEVWVPNNYEGIQRWMESSVYGMGFRYNALANKLYVDRYNNNAVPTVMMDFDRATGNIIITDSLNIGDNLDVEDDLTVGGLIYGNGSQLTDVNFTEVDPFAFYKDGSTVMTGNANFGGYDGLNFGNINASGNITGERIFATSFEDGVAMGLDADNGFQWADSGPGGFIKQFNVYVGGERVQNWVWDESTVSSIIFGGLSLLGDINTPGAIEFSSLGAEAIESIDVGYMDYNATTAHRFNNDVNIAGDLNVTGNMMLDGGKYFDTVGLSATANIRFGTNNAVDGLQTVYQVSGNKKLLQYGGTAFNVAGVYDIRGYVNSPALGSSLTAGNTLSFQFEPDTGNGYFMGDLDVGGALALGSNTLDGLSDGDINASTIYYDTLTAKSPMFMCSDDWCSVSFPKRQKTLWLQKDDDWNVLDIVYDDIHYTKSKFNSQICLTNEMTEEICSKLNSKIKKLQDKVIADNLLQQQKDSCTYSWDGECFEIVKNSVNYLEAIEIIQVPVMETINSTCSKLNDLLEVETFNCSKEIETEEVIDKYQFKENCGWEENKGYYCEVRELR